MEQHIRTQKLDSKNIAQVDLSVPKTRRGVAILSDLHIGLEENWKERASDICTVIEHLLETKEAVILNGDIFELWRYERLQWRPSRMLSKLKTIFSSMPRLLTIMQHPRLLYVYGNHDYPCSKLDNSTWGFESYKSVTILDGNTKIHIEHGHNADGMNDAELEKSSSWWRIISTWVIAKLEDIFNVNPLVVEPKVNDILFTADSERSLYENYAADIKADVVILGHTHLMYTKRLANGVHYANSGSGLDGISVVNLDSKCKLSLHKITDTNDVNQFMPLHEGQS